MSVKYFASLYCGWLSAFRFKVRAICRLVIWHWHRVEQAIAIHSNWFSSSFLLICHPVSKIISSLQANSTNVHFNTICSTTGDLQAIVCLLLAYGNKLSSFGGLNVTNYLAGKWKSDLSWCYDDNRIGCMYSWIPVVSFYCNSQHLVAVFTSDPAISLMLMSYSHATSEQVKCIFLSFISNAKTKM